MRCTTFRRSPRRGAAKATARVGRFFFFQIKAGTSLCMYSERRIRVGEDPSSPSRAPRSHPSDDSPTRLIAPPRSRRLRSAYAFFSTGQILSTSRRGGAGVVLDKVSNLARERLAAHGLDLAVGKTAASVIGAGVKSLKNRHVLLVLESSSSAGVERLVRLDGHGEGVLVRHAVVVGGNLEGVVLGATVNLLCRGRARRKPPPRRLSAGRCRQASAERQSRGPQSASIMMEGCRAAATTRAWSGAAAARARCTIATPRRRLR